MSQPTTRIRKRLTGAGADAVMAAAETFAKGNGNRVVIAVVDESGELITLRRLGNAQIASVQVAIDKARTAAIFVRPSRVLEEQVTAGRLGALALRNAAALTGGIPIMVGDEVVGAIGTSGETPDQDEAVSIAGAGSDFELEEIEVLTFSGARSVAEVAAQLATDRHVAPVVAVVDVHGELIYQWRPDQAQVASVNIALDKARTASIYRRPSKDFEDQASHGRPSALALARGVPLQGGIPIVVDGNVTGAIGVSGASSAEEDSELAMAGAASFQSDASNAQGEPFFLDSEQAAAAFARGGLLLDTATYKIDAGRREKSGEVEFHTTVTDIMYIRSGQATVVAGGEMIEPREESRGEFRASSIKGGATYHLAEGAIFAVPAGVPHWFTDVTAPFSYHVVKVDSGGGS